MAAESTQRDDDLLACFVTEDTNRARELTGSAFVHETYAAHRVLRRFVTENDGHCYKEAHLQIADLLTRPTVRRFRDAVVQDDCASVAEQLIDDPSVVNAEFTAGRGIARAIHHFKSTEVAKVLLDRGAEVNVLTTRGESPIAMQSRFGTVDGIRVLLEHGADPNLGSRPHIASSNLEAAIELLLSAGWDIQSNHQLLHDANHGHGQRVQTWLRYGVDPNQTSDTGQTALHLIAARGTGRAAIRALIDAGADVSLRDNSGQTPLDLACLASKRIAENELIALQ